LQGDFIWRYGDFVRDMKILFRDIEISNTTKKKAQILFKKTILFLLKSLKEFLTQVKVCFLKII
jgi:hypothetical protein